jgi:hypothetical protein
MKILATGICESMILMEMGFLIFLVIDSDADGYGTKKITNNGVVILLQSIPSCDGNTTNTAQRVKAFR